MFAVAISWAARRRPGDSARHRSAVPPLRLLTFAAALCALGCAFAGSALAAGGTTYSQTVTVPVPPASNYAGSGGGDGWAVALSNTQVFNVFHHNSELFVVAHNQSDGSTAWGPDVITDGTGSNFATGGQPGLYLDHTTGKLYVYATRQSDSTGGVVCIDTTQGTTNPNPFCGFTALTGAGEASLYPGWSELTNATLIGNHLYSFNYDPGHGVGPGAQNELLCFDVSTDAACAGQPFTVNFAAGSMDFFAPSPGMDAVAGKLIIPVSVAGTGQLACFNDATGSDCGSAWPASAPDVEDEGGAPFALLDSSGNQTGVCLPVSTIPCWDLNGNPVTTPAALPGALFSGQSVDWDGPGYVLGTRVYIPEWTNVVACFDYSTGASCANFPKSFDNLSLLYTVNPDPQRPTCLWVNSDNGSAQIQNFDAYSGGACGQGGIRVLASQFVVPQQKCYPTTYQSMQVTSPPPSDYQGGTATVEDADGNAVAGETNLPIDSTGSVDLTGLNPSAVNGLPQFLITLNGTSGAPTSVTIKLTWTAAYDTTCDSGGQTITPQATTTTTSLSGGGQSGANVTVPAGTSVADQATVTGANASAAAGSVTYTWYSDSACSTAIGSPDKEDLTTPGTIPASQAVTFNNPGTYYALAAYSGDAGNSPSASKCGDETVTVPATASNGPSLDGPPVTGQSYRKATVKVSAAAGDWLVAFVRADSRSRAGNRARVSGGGLSWQRIARENRALGDTEVWAAKVPSGGITNVAITARLVRFRNYDAVLTVAAFKNASGIGAHSVSHSRAGAPSVTLNTTAANSWVWAAGNDWLASKPRTAGAGQTIVQQSTDNVGDTYWVQATNALTATAGTSVTINDTAPTADPFNMVAVEILSQ
jgi:hypothetical protein